ncbi:hypothetical protein, partial [Clostridium chrysemydis]
KALINIRNLLEKGSFKMDKNVLINNNVVRLQDTNKTILNLDKVDLISLTNSDSFLKFIINGCSTMVIYDSTDSLLEDYKQLSEYMCLNAEEEKEKVSEELIDLMKRLNVSFCPDQFGLEESYKDYECDEEENCKKCWNKALGIEILK